MSQEEKDVTIAAYPEKNEAIFEGATADGMIFMQRELGTSQKATVSGNEVNGLLNKLRENKLAFSFRKA